jgi:hypothetical protein
MNLNETLELLREKEIQANSWLNSALSLKRNRNWSGLPVPSGSDAYYLPAVNCKARIKWGRVFIRHIYQFFNLDNDGDGSTEPVFLVALAEKSSLTTDRPQPIHLRRMKRKLGAGLKGLSYIGMLEPGYYTNIFTDAAEKQKDTVSWHGHFLVWGVTEKDLNGTLIK